MSSLVSNLNDNVWHNVSLRQQKSSVDFEVDSTPVTQKIAEGEIPPEFMFKGLYYSNYQTYLLILIEK